MIFLRVSTLTLGLFQASVRVCAQCQQPLTIFGRDQADRPRGHLGELIFEHSHAGESFVPTPLQFAGNEPVLRIGSVVLAMRAGSFEARLLKGIFDLASFLRLLLSLCFQSCQHRLNPERLQTVQNFLCNGTIDSHTPKGNTACDSHSIERAAANVTFDLSPFFHPSMSRVPG
jgi:hypothetical protein